MNVLQRELGRLGRLLAPALLLGLLLGALVDAHLGWSVVCLALLWLLVQHARNLARLARWAANPSPDRTLQGSGAWDAIFGQLYRHEKEQAFQLARREEDIARFQAVGQALNDGIVMLDEHDQIDWCNAMAETQFGLLLRADRGQPVTHLVRQPEFIDYLAAREFSRPLTLRGERKEDRVLSIYIVPYAGNKHLMQVKDVTQTDRLDRMRRDFVANVSHELRTPLTVLSGFIETLQEIDLSPEEQAHYLRLMGEQSVRMQAIVQDLLTLSSLEAAPPPDNETVDMTRLLDKLRRDGEALSAGRHTVTLHIQGDGDLRGAEQELTSAFGNLVTNAIRYTPAGGTVALTWRSTPQGAEFAVQDTGIGIAPEHIPRLTERFYRVARGRSRDTGGTGLGLAIVKHSLNRHQARLVITSEPGKGSRFAAQFPAHRMILPPAVENVSENGTKTG